MNLSAHDEKVLMTVWKRVHRLDLCLFTLCGAGFGWSTVIGIIPVVGDVIDGLLSLSVVRECWKIEGGLPALTKLKMVGNVALDFAIGLCPPAQGLYRSNVRNVLLLEDFLQTPAKSKLVQGNKTELLAHRHSAVGSLTERRRSGRRRLPAMVFSALVTHLKIFKHKCHSLRRRCLRDRQAIPS
ncbi:DUF4112 domain protein [Metarhizium robertsii]|uniref:DUF4112 domain protein n=1 Tax=Metarhizium robertsii TaxID=568076 RepID=A0A014P1P8_9HYPO|nr:DUF4112 domain protein [Metarhizium robertsii]